MNGQHIVANPEHKSGAEIARDLALRADSVLRLLCERWAFRIDDLESRSEDTQRHEDIAHGIKTCLDDVRALGAMRLEREEVESDMLRLIAEYNEGMCSSVKVSAALDRLARGAQPAAKQEGAK